VHTKSEIRSELLHFNIKKYSNICTNDYSIKMKFTQVYNSSVFYSNACFLPPFPARLNENIFIPDEEISLFISAFGG
jgi:hypothetical protein